MAGKKKYVTEEERQEANKASKRKYNKSAKGKAAMKHWYDIRKDTDEFKEFRNERQANYREQLPEEVKEAYRTKGAEKQAAHRKANPIKFMYSDAKKRAKAKNIEFSIVIEDIIIPEYCPVLGIPLYVAGRKRTDNSPSLDRIDNTRGYSKDNICVISFRANALKNDGSIEEFEAIINYMKERLDGVVRNL